MADIDWTTIGVALASGTTGALGPWVLHWRQGRREEKTAAAAILAEVDALATIIRLRQFVAHLQIHEEVARSRLNKGDPEPVLFPVPVSHDYNRVYKENMARLGCMNSDVATKVVRFYAILMSVVSDVSEGGVLTQGQPDPGSYRESRELLEQALVLADALRTVKR